MSNARTRSEFARELSPTLSSDERERLKSLGQELHAVVLVGDRGISEGLIENVDNQLRAHELIKVKVHHDEMVRPAARKLHEETGAQLVQSIGNALLFYRPHPDDPELLEDAK